MNPLRYRGYVYDSETGFYYVGSRYYDAENCRFVSADDIEYLGQNGTVVSYNLFAYCENNPVNMVDVTGHAAIHVVFATIGGIVGWQLGKYVANRLGYYSGSKYTNIKISMELFEKNYEIGVKICNMILYL